MWNLYRICGILIIIYVSVYSRVSFGQAIVQTVSGTISDEITLQPIQEVSINLDNGKNKYQGISDESGKFIMKNIPVGRYNITFSHLGYRSARLEEILVEAGKEVIINFKLKPAPIMLSGIELRAGTDILGSALSSYQFSNELSERIPATFYDPARIVTGYPGIAVQNDEANNVSIRGNTPVNVKWRIQGLDFVNPNHLTNAGTYSDRPSESGGGVSILSAQLLSRSKILTGAFPPQYGNALAGIFDISLREGNREKSEYTLQAGLLGVEGAAEGPFSESKRVSYLINYRYSTIGILSGLGVDLGEESIDFQDLSFNLGFDLGKAGNLTIFGLGGLSTEKFMASRDSSMWQYVEDREDTRFDSDMGGAGVVHQINLGKNSSITTRASYSIINSTRKSDFIDDEYKEKFLGYDAYNSSLISLNSEFKANLNGYLLIAGSYFDLQQFDLNSQMSFRTSDSVLTLMSGNGGYWIHQPYINLQGFIKHNFKYMVGINYLIHSLRNNSCIGPRISISWLPDKKRVIRLQYGLIGATQIPQAYYVYGDDKDPFPNISLGLTKSHQFVLGYDQQLTGQLDMTVETYYQYHYNVPVSLNDENTYSIVNAPDAFIHEIMINGGNARNIGIECILNHSFKNGNFYLMNGTLYNSRYHAQDGVWRNTHFNGQYGLGITGGHEFTKIMNGKNRTIGINGRLVYHGGFWQTPIDREASRIQGEAVYLDREAFTIKLQDYYRLDLGCYFKMYKKNYTRTLLIAIQNVTNHKNIAYQYFDLEQNDIINHYQLGIIPSISYRVEF